MNSADPGKELSIAIGAAIFQWKRAELALFKVFCELTRFSNLRLASAIYFSNDHFRDGLKLIDRLIYADIGAGHLVTQWRQLSSKCEAANTKRNEIVHWPLAIDHKGEVLGFLQKDYFALNIEVTKSRIDPIQPLAGTPTFNQILAHTQTKKAARSQKLRAKMSNKLSAKVVRQYAAEFQSLESEIHSFADRAAYIMSLTKSV